MIDVVIIGAGHNGLIAAALLAKAGNTVLVLERQPIVGGMAITREFADGFKAPTLAHSLGPLTPDVTKALRKLKFDRTGPPFVTPDPALTSLGANGELITFHRDPVFTAESINRLQGNTDAADAGRWRPFLDSMQRLAAVFRELQRQPVPDIDDPSRADLWRLLNMGRSARKLGKKNLSRLLRYVPMAVADLASEWFSNDLMRATIASRGIFGHFAGPWSAGTGGLFLQRMADDPMPVGSGLSVAGGPGALMEALKSTAEAAGATVRTSAGVGKILIANGTATGVVLETGEEIRARVVLGAIDPKLLLQKLIDPVELPPVFTERVRNIRSRGVTAKINLALSTAPVFDALHGDDISLRGRLLIASGIDALERAFDSAKYGELPETPWLEISVPTIVDGTLAPEGAHVVSIIAHTIPQTLRNAEWDSAENDAPTGRDQLYRRVLDVIAAHAPALESSIVGAEVITPNDIEETWGAAGGHIFHGEQTLDQWWATRPLLGWANGRTPVERLILTGAGTHGGGGVTGGPALHAVRVTIDVLKEVRRN